MVFEEYLTTKKINYELFIWSDEVLFHNLKVQFNQMHPESFTAQKKFMINGLRRKYKMTSSV